MDILFRCACGQQLVTDDAKAGSSITCPTCLKELTVPSESQRPADRLDDGHPDALRGRVVDRYRDGYAIANAICLAGGLIKALGWLVAVGGGVLPFALGDQYYTPVVVRMGLAMASIASGVLVIGVGTFVSGQGQILRATLDSAVYASPFLDLQGKREAMHI